MIRKTTLLLSVTIAITLILGAFVLLGSPTAPVAASANAPLAFPVIADFEGGVPANWFVYGDGGTTVNVSVPTIPDNDPLALPGQVGDNDVLSVVANVPTWAGFGAGLTPAQNWSDYDALSFWFYGGDSGDVHEVEIQTANVGNRRATFADDFTGWRQVILPFHTFGAGGAFDVSQVTNWVFVLDGADSQFLLDNLQLVNLQPFADFEGGVPAGWFQYSAGGANVVNVSVPTIPDTDPLALPGQVGDNDILAVTATVPDWAGYGAGFTPAQNWSDMQGVSFWFYGENSGEIHEFEIQTANAGNRRATFVDNFSGWRTVVLPFATFGDTPYDVSQVTNWVMVLDGMDGSFYQDHISVYGDAGNVTSRVQFAANAYSVVEGQTVTLTVNLNVASAETITVDFATADGTATSSDYTPVNGTLTFDPGELSQTIVVETIDNNIADGNRTFTVHLSNPVNAELGIWSVATVTIQDDEVPDYSSALTDIVDDFENGLPAGVDGDGNAIGFITWGDFWSGTTVAITTTLVSDSDPLALPGQSGDNHLLQFTAMVNGWGGLTHAFANEDLDTWTPQDWSSYEGISFWLYGQNTGNDLLFEIQDNRNPGSTVADAEIWSHAFVDDFSGWRLLMLDFDDDFVRKEIGNGAPDDGFGRDEVHGWAFGSLSTGGATVTYYLDNVALIIRTTIVDDFENGLPEGVDGDGNAIGFITWGDFWSGTTVAITTTLVSDSDPLALPGQSGDNHLLQFTAMVNGWGGMTHAFENEDLDTWVTQDWSSYEGIAFWLYGQNTGNDLLFEIQDNRNPGSTVADAEIWSHAFVDDFSGWRLFVLDFDDDFVRKEIGNGAPDDGFGRDEVHGWAFGSLNTGGATVTYYLDNVLVYGNTGSDQPLRVAFTAGRVNVIEGQTAVLTVALNQEHTETVTVDYATAESNANFYQYTPVSGALTFPAGTLTQTISIDTYHDGKHTRDVRVAVNLYEGDGAPLGFQRRAILTIVDIDPADPRLVDDFQGAHPFIYQEGMVELSITTLTDDSPLAVPGQWAYEDVLTVEYDGEAYFGRVFAQGQDWSAYDGISFWFYGQNSGETFTFQLRDNMAATTAEVDPDEWVLVWSDEFDGPAGTRPNPNVWKFELGDGALNNIVGWGNSEFQFYTDSAENSFLDGDGNLVIRLQDTAPDTDLVCWYGPCEYTSARLLTQDRLDFEYGRIEARVQVPGGPGGLWPAFWMLGSNIPEVGWPQSGEIDIMEYVSRLPYEVFGTIHGPGYEGGASFGNILTFTDTVPNQGFLTYGVIWMPDHIIWYVDDVQYHQAVPANVAPNEWVFNHPFFMLLNQAIGGNFGGAISGSMTFPQDTLVDFVRVYQAADTAERFEASFVDDFSGWQQVSLPFSAFSRSAQQPPGAPDDGLGLDEVWGYGVILPADNRLPDSGTFHMDQVKLITEPTAVAFSEVSAGGPVSSSSIPGLIGVGFGLLTAAGLALLLARRRLAYEP